jgi:hypothetical protein
MTSGEHTLNLDRKLACGTYVVTLETGNDRESVKLAVSDRCILHVSTGLRGPSWFLNWQSPTSCNLRRYVQRLTTYTFWGTGQSGTELALRH